MALSARHRTSSHFFDLPVCENLSNTVGGPCRFSPVALPKRLRRQASRSHALGFTRTQSTHTQVPGTVRHELKLSSGEPIGSCFPSNKMRRGYIFARLLVSSARGFRQKWEGGTAARRLPIGTSSSGAKCTHHYPLTPNKPNKHSSAL
ncbi:hypothetical protein VTI74DRAFT_6017 [Chaetomium olivicolor]